jgi:hypothetical protein
VKSVEFVVSPLPPVVVVVVAVEMVKVVENVVEEIEIEVTGVIASLTRVAAAILQLVP